MGPGHVNGQAPLAVTPGLPLGDGGNIGIRLGRVSEALAAHLGRDVRSMILIQDVLPGSAAERAGLQRLDVITAIDGEPASYATLERAKRDADGDPIRLDIVRRGQALTVLVQPEGRPATSTRNDAFGRARDAYSRALQDSAGQWWRSQDAYDRARSFYDQVDAEAFRETLERGLDQSQSQATRRALESLLDLDRPELDEYLGEVRGLLEDARFVVPDSQRRAARGLLEPQARERFLDAQRQLEARGQADDAQARARTLDAARALIETRRRELEALEARIRELRAGRSGQGTAR